MSPIARLFDAAAPQTAPDCAPFEVHALRYATREGTRRENFIDGDPHDGPMPLSYYVWLARSSRMTVLIDTGFSREVAEARGRSFLRCPIDALQLLGVSPGTIEHVVLTHLHYDHCGNLDRLPEARFHLQDAEMAYATGRYMGHACCARAFELDDVVRMMRLNYAGRAVFHDGHEEMAPGIELYRVGGHSAGLQIVRLWTRRGWMVLASDASHFYENVEHGRPFRLAFHVGQMLDAFTVLKRLASSPELVVPGHDPLVMERFPRSAPGLEGIAVQLA